jgi:putative addiction module component (TIGR02574 family)
MSVLGQTATLRRSGTLAETIALAGADFHSRGITARWYRRTVKIDSLEKEVLSLPPEERARLAELLLSSLDELTESELERVWFAEAQRRAEQIDSGAAQLIPSEEVEKKARSLLR